MSRKRGRITVQSQPTKGTRLIQRLAMIPILIVGAFLVFVGITEVIPKGGLFGVIWTLMAATFLVSGIVQMVRKNGMAHRVGYDVEDGLDESIVGIMEDVVGSDGSPKSGSIESRLLELQSLYDGGLVTREEYEEKRKEILKQL